MGTKATVSFRYEHGLDIDLNEAWEKIANRQFGGPPQRAFAELIQNFLDSYPAGTEWSERIAKITANKNKVAIIDYGEGMSLARIKLMTTL